MSKTKTYKLMIKTHSVTGLKYLCITNRKNWESYTGSGTYWNRHLKKHGYSFSTELLFETADYDVFLNECFYYSLKFNVVLNDEFANIVPETAYENDNRILFWKYASENIKRELYNKRAESLKENWKNNYPIGSEEYTLRIETLKTSIQDFWKSKTIEERREMIKPFLEGRKAFFYEKGENYQRWKTNVGNATRHRMKNMTPEERKTLGRNIAKGRLEMSDEAKALRATRVSESFKNSQKRKDFNKRMKTERLGINNPGAMIFLWEGNKFSKKEFIQYVKEKGLTDEYVEEKFRNDPSCVRPNTKHIEYEDTICPHCNKSGKKTNAFLRWHFDNCKKRNT
jgi:hypothetical protein